MPILYTVRCRFTVAEKEAEWNEWYLGHLDKLLRVPGFLAAQRFHSDATVDDRPYMAMYQVAGLEVFKSEEYLSIWGFDEWLPLIDNWTRDLYQLRQGPDLEFATPVDGHNQVAFLSGIEPVVEDAVAAIAPDRPGLREAAVTGLDHSCASVAWQVGGEPLPELPAVEVAQAAYTPITECFGPRS
jgi:hypothetical protein